MTTDRIIDIVFTVALLVVTSVAVWRHQNRPEPSEAPEKQRET